MTTRRQRQTAHSNVKKAIAAAKRERTISKLSSATRHSLGVEGAKARRRHGKAGHALEDRNRTQLFAVARKLGIAGRSRMGKWDLIDAIRKRRGSK